MSITDDGDYGAKQVGFLEIIWGEGFLSPGGIEELDLMLSGLDILTKDRYHRKSSLHNEPISMLDAICGLLQKINRKANNDLTTKQVAFFNQILKDFGKDWIGNDMALSGDFIDMVTIKDTAQNTAFGNGLFELGR